MAEESRPWPGTTVGDAGPYSDDDWDDIWEVLYGSGAAPYNDRGVIRNWLNELEVTDGGANTADIDTGAALVHGKFYNHTAPVINLNIPNSVGAWREDLVCLRSDWTPQTIRIFRHANPADTVAYPAPTQNDGVDWEIPLAAVRINAAGAITLITDLRDYVSDLMQPKELQVLPRTGAEANAGDSLRYNYHFGILLDGNGEHAGFEFIVPDDFKELVSAEVIWISNGNSNLIDVVTTVRFGQCGESSIANTDTQTILNITVSTALIHCEDVADSFTNIEAGDVVGFEFTMSDVDGLGHYVLMLVLRYK